MEQLFERSIRLIRSNQAPSGAYVASPTFATYNYSWFRDGSYIAYAMDLRGEHDSARRFYNWAASMVVQRREQVERLVAGGYPPAPSNLLDTRYTLDGRVGEEEWPNFQLDGFGTLLWGMEQHLLLSDYPLPDEWRDALGLLHRYLAKLWMLPCFDCWEESEDKIHTATLAALYGGMMSAARLLGAAGNEAAATAAAIRAFVRENLVQDGALCKFIGNPAVDASLIHVATPYRLLEPDDPIMVRTVALIEQELRSEGGGVHRYANDSYYGGGEWILLTAYLGWYYSERGEYERAAALLDWIHNRATPAGLLPEQVAEHLNHPEKLAGWIALWGPSACPLLWSHAAYLTLATKIGAPALR